MTHKEIEKYRKQLVEILQGEDAREDKSRQACLKELAEKVGASAMAKAGMDNAGEAELVDNIHFALQTASMMDMCRTAAKNYWIAFVAALVALASAIAAWTAVYVGVLEKIGRLHF
jgi:hypothetical protein